ncbi:hypothetical protein OG295_36565 [Streptomyces sp. NBC_01276]
MVWVWLPHDLPPKSATCYYFAAWRDDGTDQAIHELLRCQVRERARRLEDPTLVGPDTQSVHAAAGVPASTSCTGRLLRAYEHRPAPSVFRIYWAMTQVMARRLTGESTPTWRDPQMVSV